MEMMKPVNGIPLLVSVLVGLVLGLLTWGALRLRPQNGEGSALMHDEVIIGLLVVAAFALGAFATFVLLGLTP